jgi:hypothetical protein
VEVVDGKLYEHTRITALASLSPSTGEYCWALQLTASTSNVASHGTSNSSASAFRSAMIVTVCRRPSPVHKIMFLCKATMYATRGQHPHHVPSRWEVSTLLSDALASHCLVHAFGYLWFHMNFISQHQFQQQTHDVGAGLAEKGPLNTLTLALARIPCFFASFCSSRRFRSPSVVGSKSGMAWGRVPCFSAVRCRWCRSIVVLLLSVLTL